MPRRDGTAVRLDRLVDVIVAYHMQPVRPPEDVAPIVYARFRLADAWYRRWLYDVHERRN
jgi:hypothetical protein